MPVQCTCATCGTPFPKSPSKVRKWNFCSSSCWYVSHEGKHVSPKGVPVVGNDGITARIPLHVRGGAVVAYALIDAADAEWASRWRWGINEGYARRGRTYLHRALLGLTPGDDIEGDHINRDRLDCRRVNLRAIPHAGNRQNHPSRGGTSSHRGVSWIQRSQKWMAYIQVQGQTTSLGLYMTEDEAATAARAARARLMPYATD